MIHGNTTRASNSAYSHVLFAWLAMLCFTAACCAVLLTPVSANAEEQTQTASAEEAVEQKNESKSPLEVGSALPSTSALGAKIIKGTLYCIGALLLVFALIKKFAPKEASGENPIHIIAKRSLGQKNSLILIEVFDQQFIIGATGENLSLITQVKEQTDFGKTLAEQFREEAALDAPSMLKQVGA